MENLTAKERARKLVVKMQFACTTDLSSNYEFNKAKQCALIAVNLILNEVGAKDWGNDELTKSNYWQDVKKEINLL